MLSNIHRPRLVAAQEKVRAKADVIAKQAIGQPFTIRLEKNLTQSGIIQEAEFARFNYGVGSVYAVFKIVMLCGSAKVPKTFYVRNLPGSDE